MQSTPRRARMVKSSIPGTGVFSIIRKPVPVCPICKEKFSKNYVVKRHLVDRHSVPKDAVKQWILN
ncbi:hypothetical protein A0J61_02937 [Choanephora cucurbitarum]|uniref:C2H2-type domain-containing protein n=1 Tax=Choanephora cucurbitarum TaxID=101091 RepID=A0A1C7NJR5_9FUNG|nr:hypothetical protein A0J61_02937 [Choanephora cucurbitarum]